MDILKEITDKRRGDIAQKGFSFGHSIPEKRTRAIVPFLPEPGTVLEIKRASPSKGWIAPDLDSAQTAQTYASAGTSAISVLTEENYFHGTLEDLQKAANAAGEKVAILRKDFLLECEEIEIAYRCGADAVLLIGRILEKDQLLKMAKTAFDLGISVLLEIREDSDIEKAFYVLELAHQSNADDKIVLGINSRDLKTFTIDLLIPLRLKEKIGKLYTEKGVSLPFPRIISESGVTSPAAADFVGHLGFSGVLIGEAAARNPLEAKNLVSSFVKAAKSQKIAEENGEAKVEYAFWRKLAVLLENKGVAKANNSSTPNTGTAFAGSFDNAKLHINGDRPLAKANNDTTPNTDTAFAGSFDDAKLHINGDRPLAKANSNTTPNTETAFAGSFDDAKLHINGDRPLTKICGIKETSDVLKATELGADILGFIFAAKSPRTNELDEENFVQLRKEVLSLCENKKIKLPLMIGVVVDPESKEGKFAVELCKKGILDAIQYHGCAEKADGKYGYPVIPLAEEKDLQLISDCYAKGFPRIIIDAKNLSSDYAQGDSRYGGTGKTIPSELVEKAKKMGSLWLSGGLSPDNITQTVKNFTPELVDIASGVEQVPGKKDFKKLENLFENLK